MMWASLCCLVVYKSHANPADIPNVIGYSIMLYENIFVTIDSSDPGASNAINAGNIITSEIKKKIRSLPEKSFFHFSIV